MHGELRGWVTAIEMGAPKVRSGSRPRNSNAIQNLSLEKRRVGLETRDRWRIRRQIRDLSHHLYGRPEIDLREVALGQGFGQEADHVREPGCPVAVEGAARTGQDHDLARALHLLSILLQEGEAVDLGHIQVQEDDIGDFGDGVGRQVGKGLTRRPESEHLAGEAAQLDESPLDEQVDFTIVDQGNYVHRFVHTLESFKIAKSHESFPYERPKLVRK